MELFSKAKLRLFSLSSLAIALVVSFFCFVEYLHYKKEKASQSAADPVKLIAEAKVNIDHDPDLAGKQAVQALTLSEADRNNTAIIQSWLILGKLSNIQGKKTEAFNFYLNAQKLSRQKHLSKEFCEATLGIGEIKYKRGEYHQSLKDFMLADSIASRNNFEQLKAYTSFYIGKYNQTTGNFRASNSHYHQALDIAKKYNDKRLLTLILPSLGKYYISEGKLHIALQMYLEALHISNQLNDYLLNADICNHLGGLYLQMNEYNKALEFHKKALAYRNEMNNPEGLAKSYNNIGKAYVELKQPDTALFYFKQSLLLCKGVNYKKGMIKAQINIGNLYIRQHQPANGKEFLAEAFQQSKKISYDAGIAESSLAMGDFFKSLNALDSAISYYQLSLSKLSKTNYDEELRNVYKDLYECYAAKEDYRHALQYHETMLEKEKKLLNVENNRQLALLNITYDTERKEKDYQVLLKDNALKESLLKSKNAVIWLIIVILSFTILLCLYIYNRFYIKKKANNLLEALNYRITNQNEELEKLNRELGQLSKEKDKLFSIISHELRNPLYWLQNLAEALSHKHHTMSPEKIKKTLLSLDESAKNVYHLMDNLLYWSRSKLNRIHPRKAAYNLHALVCETVQMYDSFFHQKEIELSNTISNTITIYADPNLFGCVIRNLISNAIKYTPNNGVISIACTVTDSFVTLVVSDSGKGISGNDLKLLFDEDMEISMPGLMQEKGSGLGLKLCKDFVELNDGSIWAESIEGKGTHVYFTVPCAVGISKEELAEMKFEEQVV